MKWIFVLTVCLQALQQQAQNNPAPVVSIEKMEALFKANKADELVSYAENQSRLYLDGQGKPDTVYAAMLGYLFEGYQMQQNRSKTEKTLQQILQALESCGSGQSKQYENYLSKLALFYKDSGRYQESEAAFKSVLALAKVLFGEQKPNYLKTVINMASLYKAMGKYELAEDMFLKALQTLEKTDNTQHVFYTKCLNNLGSLYSDMGRFEEAEPILLKVLDIYKKKETFDNGYLIAFNNLGSLYFYAKRYREAGEIFLAQEGVCLANNATNTLAYINALNNIGNVYGQTKDFVKASEYYNQAYALYKEKLGEEHVLSLTTLSNLGLNYAELKQYDLAEKSLTKALTIRQKILGERHPQSVSSLNNLLRFYIKNQKNEQARQIAQTALFVNTSLNISLEIGDLWADSLKKADYSTLNEALETLEGLYEMLRPQPEQKQACVLLADVALLLLKRLRDGFDGEDEKLRILEDNAKWMSLRFLNMDMERDAEQAFAIAEQNKSIFLMDAIKSETAYSLGFVPDSLIGKEKQLQEKYTAIKAALLEKDAENRDSLNEILIETNKEIELFKKHLQKTNPDYFAHKYEETQISTAAVRAWLPAKTALLEYVVTDSLVYIFWIDANRSKLTVVNMEPDSLRRRIHGLHTALSDYNRIALQPDQAYEAYTEAAHWFYQKILAPVLPDNQEIDALVIVPDGELAHLPFEVFLTAPSKGESYSQLPYLIKQFKISYNYSAALSLVAGQKRPNNGKMLAMAANYEQADSDTVALLKRSPSIRNLRSNLTPLPAARKEVEMLQGSFYGHFAFDEQASERAFKEKAGEYAVVHLALHGILNKKSPLLSGLAFTENGDSAENNLLQAYEISGMQLGAELVVLSACETGFGRFEKGNGTASLARSFMYAGAPALVVSLWEVNDASTSKIMQFFYMQLSAGVAKPEALRQAKLQYLSESKGIAGHPAFWSAFVQIGNTDPLRTNFAASRLKWWWIIGSLGLLLAALVWRLRKRTR